MLIRVFARHRVACNLLMMMMMLAGAWALTRLNTQFFPTFELDFISVRVTWTGAAAEDVETAITNVIEEELRTVDGLRTMTSSSSQDAASIALEFEEGTDMAVALDQVKERVALIRNLPASAEEPEIGRLVRYEPVARVLVHGPQTMRELRSVTKRIERELLGRGIAKVDMVGLPKEELAIEVPSAVLHELELSLGDIAAHVASQSRDIPAGTVGQDDVSRRLRALQQRRNTLDFESLRFLSDEGGMLLRLGDVARVERRQRAGQTQVLFRDEPAVEIRLSRTEGGDSLDAARALEQWRKHERPLLPPSVHVEVFDQSWELIRDRITLLLKNGFGGLVLVVLILFCFLNARVAWWVAAGIPVSFMAALGVLHIVGGSINMISLFALIMTLGIIVDDAIVVAEDALTHYQNGESAVSAAEGGAIRMLAPVLSSSLTTVAAFLPLMLVGGIIGNIMFDIPLVLICVVLASLVESFLILPGHLRHAFLGLDLTRRTRLRAVLDRAFESGRDCVFRPLVTLSVCNAPATVCLALALLMLAAGLLAGGRVSFNFFPSPEGRILNADVSFVAGTPPARVRAFMAEVEAALRQTEAHFGEPLIELSTTVLGQVRSEDGRGTRSGDQFASVTVQLSEPDRRRVRNPSFIKAWRDRVSLPAGLESFSIVERRAGPPGRDVDVRLISDDAVLLKAAALELAEVLSGVRGVSGVKDDMPYGAQQLIYDLTPQGRALGLTVESIGTQLRSAYDGRIAQIFQDRDDEVEVRVMLPDKERHVLSSLDTLNLTLPGGGLVPLRTVVELGHRRGFDILRHTQGRLSLRVSADVDPTANNNNSVIAALEAQTLPRLKHRYGIEYEFEGRQADQQETLSDMRLGGAYALMMIYLVLAWVFSSYGWPLVVMAVIPFGLIGAVTGHWLLGLDLTVLSMFGLFGLSGIVVNDSIILVMFYKRLTAQGIDTTEAIIEAACQRLRAVLLTSLTTIAGLLPLMFETSLQAQFLIPMAVSISFGLAFSTVLVLFVLPSLLQMHESIARRLWDGSRRPVVQP